MESQGPGVRTPKGGSIGSGAQVNCLTQSMKSLLSLPAASSLF